MLTCEDCGAARVVMITQAIRLGRVLRLWHLCVACFRKERDAAA